MGWTHYLLPIFFLGLIIWTHYILFVGDEREMEELKPCPFCGGKNVEVTQEDCFGFDNDEWLIHCDNCGLQFGFGKQYKTKSEVIEAWNGR